MRPRPRAILSIAVPCVVLLVLLLLMSCTISVDQPDPAGYVHYVPRPGSLFRIEFDYPATWDLGGDEEDMLPGLLIAELASARPTPIPTYAIVDPTNDIEPGMIILDVEEVDPTIFSLVRRVVPYVEEQKRHRDYVTLESSRAMQIDGFPAHRVSTVWPPGTFHNITTQRIEWVFLVAGSRFYQISLQTPERLREGPFARGFEHLLSSIRIKH